MEKIWDRNDQGSLPDWETLAAYVGSPLWENLRAHLESVYQARFEFSYSRCPMMPGWNVKCRKSGRALCTLYPMEGHFVALVVLGDRERREAEPALTTFSDYFGKVYREAPVGMGRKWLMLEVRDAAVLEDVKRCIALRREAARGKF